MLQTSMDRETTGVVDNSDSSRLFERVTKMCRCYVHPQGTLAVDGTKPGVAGWTQDCSVTGVRFRCMKQINGDRVILQLEDMPGKGLDIAIVRASEIAPGHWEYGARFLGVVPLETSAPAE